MDPELKAYLDEMQRRNDQQLTVLRAEMHEMDRQNRVLQEETRRQAAAIAEGQRMLREHVDRRFGEHDRNWEQRVQPIAAAVRVNADDLRAIKHDIGAVRDDVADLRRRDVGNDERITSLERRRPRS